MFIPLRLLIPNPADLLGLVPLTSIDQLDAIGVTGIDAAETSDGTVLRASLATAPGHELTVSVPGFPDLALVLRDLASLEILVSPNPAARIAVESSSSGCPGKSSAQSPKPLPAGRTPAEPPRWR